MRADPDRDENEPLSSRHSLALSRGANIGLLFQASDPDHEKLVEVAREDRQEEKALELRHRIVLGELEHPLVEIEGAEFEVEEVIVCGADFEAQVPLGQR